MGLRQKWRTFYTQYKDYFRVDVIMYLVMFLGVFVFLGIMVFLG